MRSHRLKALLLACSCLSLIACYGVAQAQDAAAPSAAPVSSSTGNQVVRYDADYFKQYQVNTAFDMVLHVPGFVFDGGESARGFSGTAGNVLIDGQRPATKADLGNTLSNINAAQVDHVDLITGGAPGIDMHGHRQIVNVIRKLDAKPSLSLLGIWRNMGGRDNKGVLLFTYNANHNGKSTDVTADVFNFFDNGVNHAKRTITHANGTVETLDIPQHAGGAGVESQASHSRPLWGGKLSLNATYNPSIYQQDSSYIDSATATETFIDKDTPSELGAQYERKFAHGLGVDFNVLSRHEREHQLDNYIDASGEADYRALILSNEQILSGRLSWQKRDGLSFSLGSESAFNSRDETSSFTVNATSQNVPTSTVRVEEQRTESFANVNWKATPKLSLEAELKVETSTISVPQDGRSDSFVYYKPRFQAVYAISDKTKISWKMLRQVDQLSFSSFASSVQLQTNVVTLGNTALVPQKSWLNTLILEHSFWDKGALTLALEHYDVEDTSDFIAIFDGPNVYTASGNAGDSKWDFLKVKLDLPLDRMHIKHGMLNIDWTYRQTTVKDPVTGHDRRVSGLEPHQYSVSFSQEFTSIRTSWGIDIEGLNNDRYYLAKELTNSHFDPWTQIWFQYKTPKKLQLKVTFRNPLGLRFTNDRTVWQGLRDQSPVDFNQHQVSKIPQILEVRLKKEF